MATPRYDDIRVAFARLDELQMHWLYGREVLVDDFIQRPSAITRVSLDTTDESNVGVGVDEYFDVAELAHAFVDEEEDAIDHNDVGGLDAYSLPSTKVGDEVILRFIDRSTITQRFKVVTQQLVVECVGVIPIELAPFVEGELRKVLVVSVHIDERDR